VRYTDSFIDALADLHSLDPDALGLSDLGKKDSYVGRQLKTWYRSWMASIEPARYDDPRAHSLQQYFLTNTARPGARAHRAWRLRPAQLPGRPRLAPSRRWSTGRSRRWAIRWPTWPMR
jgi:hypothetical protein